MADPAPDPGLALEAVTAGYGEAVVLDRISLALPPGQTLALLGRNGVGQSTLLATIMGHTTLHGGRIAFAGTDITALPTWRRPRLGIGYVPQEREIFPSLSVDENLTVPARGTRWSVARVYDLFPNLARRRTNMGNQLSGGEQQMLSIGRALMGDPTLLLLDEPLEGLAPVIVDALMESFARLKREDSLAIVLVEQQALDVKGAIRTRPDTVVINQNYKMINISNTSYVRLQGTSGNPTTGNRYKILLTPGKDGQHLRLESIAPYTLRTIAQIVSGTFFE